jgi:hypothetical protein
VFDNRQIECCSLVLIEWEDSAQPVPGWHPVAAYKSVEAIRCVSVGWLVCDTRQVKALAPNFADVDDPDDIQASGVIRIPSAQTHSPDSPVIAAPSRQSKPLPVVASGPGSQG